MDLGRPPECAFALPEFGSRRWHAWGVFVVLWAVLAGLPGLVLAADIRSTPHNLAQQSNKAEAGEVCVFCHTPTLTPSQLARSGVAQPAWQPSMAANHSFVMFDDIGRLQFGDKPAVGSQSIACLSCHDANQAFSAMAADTDHPFGVPYRGYVRDARRKAADKDEDASAPARSAHHLKAVDDFRIPSSGLVDNRRVWWVSAAGSTPVRTRGDLPLYARRAESGEVPYVECSSCHDPHITNRLFLRVNNEGSRLCLTCHDK